MDISRVGVATLLAPAMCVNKQHGGNQQWHRQASARDARARYTHNIDINEKQKKKKRESKQKKQHSHEKSSSEKAAYKAHIACLCAHSLETGITQRGARAAGGKKDQWGEAASCL